MTSDCPQKLHVCERKTRVRHRSRFGCRNCKLRKLKCDEVKPQCRKCRLYGVLCNFISNVPDLHPVAACADTKPLVVRGRGLQCRPSRPLSKAVWTSDASGSYYYFLNAKCQDFITRYLGRSLITPDDPNMAQVNRKLLELAFACPFLMHASLAVALTYDRYLNGLDSSFGGRRTAEECYHWSQATILLNKRLAKPIEEEDKDPIWGTAAALVILTFSSPASDPRTPQQAWPLSSSASPCSDLDLDWLRMTKGKMALWHMLDPLRPGSIFCVMADTFATMRSPSPRSGIDGIPDAMAAICNLDHSSTPETNPYFEAAHAVSAILDIPDNKVTLGHTQLFTRSIHGHFEDLLRRRDAIALLLLYLWYRKVGRCIWWIELRARVECPSIELFLRRYYGRNGDVLAFLPGGCVCGELELAGYLNA
ncbi:Zn(II)2Cys6 transcription factor domain-containing protein [Aspergillus undulatus]|uniref:Zn(II)2Cys6 transcription factor domain-containing protein n=1 Tax=Aspergillus undulatus TaxID=1810928 RepID=UPI003CCDC28A